jgi:glutamyl-Q tRNA(Asp) synthetase
LLRIDDLDAPRCAPGADQQILRQLEAHGLRWDEEPRYQSRHLDEYVAARERLRQAGRIYGCDCTRSRLETESRSGIAGRVYSSRCRDRGLALDGNAQRLHIGGEMICINDPWQGPQQRQPIQDLGDFVIWRRDGVPGYALACVVDDLAMGISNVVRGADLLDASLQQKALFAEFGASAPHYAHLPVLEAADGRKLSKQNHAAPLHANAAPDNLRRCLRWLGQPPLDEGAACSDILQHAVAHWTPAQVPALRAIPVEQSR